MRRARGQRQAAYAAESERKLTVIFLHVSDEVEHLV